ncbi:MAG: hypothetical protein H6600_06785 [Flavobacteriales bacterium]|nr:hypothetical protein [Flavobacteriales bacterium]MCB9198145.1 hypothetical protein [Flavobacteriales bacterium]
MKLKEKSLAYLVLLGPFFLSLILMMYNLSFISKLALMDNFSLNLYAVGCVFLVYLALIITFYKKGLLKNYIHLKSKFRYLGMIGFSIFLIGSSALLVLSIRMNLNYWLRDQEVEKIEITVEGKHTGNGRVTDHYISIKCPQGNFSYKVSESADNEKFIIGESYTVEVNKGFYDGYYLLQKLN